MPGPWEETLKNTAEQPPVNLPHQGRWQDFVASAWNDPASPVVAKAGIPLGLGGRVAAADQITGEANMGFLTGMLSNPALTYKNWTGPDNQVALAKQWDENLLSDVPMLGGILGSILAPSSVLTLGMAPLRAAGRGAQALLPGVEKLAPLASPLVATNTAADWVGAKAWNALSYVGSKAAGGINAAAPTLLKESAESVGRKAGHATIDLFQNLRRNKVSLVATDLATYKLPKGKSWKTAMGEEIESLENYPVGDNPLLMITKALVMEDATIHKNMLSRPYEVESLALEAAHDAAGLEDLGREYFRNVVGNVRAAKKLLDDASTFVREGPISKLPDNERAALTLHLRAVMDDVQTRRNALLTTFERDKAAAAAAGTPYEAGDFQLRDNQLIDLQNQMILEVQDAYTNFMRGVVSGPPAPDIPNFIRAELSPEVAARFSGQLQSIRQGARGNPVEGGPFVDDDTARNLLLPFGSVITKSVRRLNTAKARVMDTLADAIEARLVEQQPKLGARTAPPQPDYTAGALLSTDVLPTDRSDRSIKQALQTLGIVTSGPEDLTADELLKGLQNSISTGKRLLNAEDQAVVVKAIEDYNKLGIDLLNDDAGLVAASEVYSKAVSELPGQQAWRPIPSVLRRNITDPLVTNWTTQALAAPSTILRNAISGFYNHAAMGHGSELREVYGRLKDQFDGLLRGPVSGVWDLLPKVDKAWRDTYEIDPPPALLTSQADMMLEVLGEAKRMSQQRWSRFHMAGLGALMGRGSPVDTALGAAAGFAQPEIRKVVRWFNGAVEYSLRMTRFQHVVSDMLADAAPSFIADLRPVLLEGRKRVQSDPSGYVPAHVVTEAPDISEEMAIENVLERLKLGAFGTETLTSWLRGLGRVVDEDKLNHFVTRWANTQAEAKRAGVAAANAIHFDYVGKTKLEETAHQFSPFLTWGIRSTPQFVERLLSNPVLATALYHYSNLSVREVDKAGMSKSYYGQVPMRDFASRWVASLLNGRPMDAYWVNPLTLGLPTEGVLGAIGRNITSENPLDLATGLARTVGLGMAGPYDQLITSVTDREAATPNILRHSNLLTGLIGAVSPDLAQFLQVDQPGLVDYARRLVGQDPYIAITDKVARRLDEMSVERTGNIGTPAYMAAKQDRNSPLYKEALGEVLRQQLITAANSLVNPLGGRPVSMTEAAIRKEHQYYPQGAIDTEVEREAYTQARRERPLGAAYQATGTSGGGDKSRLKHLVAVSFNPVPLVPGASDEHAKAWQLYQYYRTAATNLGQPLSSIMPKSLWTDPFLRQLLNAQQTLLQDPLYLEYMAWRTQFHPDARAEGEDSLIDQFLSQR